VLIAQRRITCPGLRLGRHDRSTTWCALVLVPTVQRSFGRRPEAGTRPFTHSGQARRKILPLHAPGVHRGDGALSLSITAPMRIAANPSPPAASQPAVTFGQYDPGLRAAGPEMHCRAQPGGVIERAGSDAERISRGRVGLRTAPDPCAANGAYPSRDLTPAIGGAKERARLGPCFPVCRRGAHAGRLRPERVPPTPPSRPLTPHQTTSN
jgi:hypothetical protein